jgi:Legionella pneumophila major outer membrane protein precursor
MRNRRIFAALVLAAGLVAGPAAHTARAQPEAWDVSGNDCTPVWAPIGTYQHDGSGWYTGVEFIMLHQPRAIGHQPIAIRGFVDSAGLLTGTPGAFVGSKEQALTTAELGRTGWSPGQRLTFGYRLENGWNFSISWLHLFDTKYSAGAGMQGANFLNPGANLENTFLFSPVFNFSPEFVGPVARTTTGGNIAVNGFVVFGALDGIWNGASDMTILFTQRFDNWDLAGRFPVFETENARSYAIAGGRFSWFWERFQWRTVATGFEFQGQPEGEPPHQTNSPEWTARYLNTLSQRMYGPMVGVGHEVILYSGVAGAFGLGTECTGALLVDIVKERAKYIREDKATQSKRSWVENKIVPNFDASINLTWQPVDGVTFRAGYNLMTYFDTLYIDQPVGFNFQAIDPAYEKKWMRCLYGCNFGVAFTW